MNFTSFLFLYNEKMLGQTHSISIISVHIHRNKQRLFLSRVHAEQRIVVLDSAQVLKSILSM